jgi:hypothetical protein
MSRLRAGEWVAGVGATGLLVVLFFNWFGLAGRALGWVAYAPVGVGGLSVDRSGWGSLGWFMDLLLCASILGGLSLSYMTVRRVSPAWPVGTAVLTWTVGGLVFLVLAVRVATQPDLGHHLPNAGVTVELAAYLGLLFAALIPVGGFLSVYDERTHSAEARDYTPPPARPVPGT